jgi:predicted dinucleotide-utilizing enzyme
MPAKLKVAATLTFAGKAFAASKAFPLKINVGSVKLSKSMGLFVM